MTIIMGSLIIINALCILYFSESIWRLLSIYSILFGISCFLVFFHRHNILLRRILLGMYAIDILIPLAYFALSIVSLVQLKNDGANYFFNAAIIRFIVFATIRVIFLIILGTVLYGGLKEQ